jgi:hypothetical protein
MKGQQIMTPMRSLFAGALLAAILLTGCGKPPEPTGQTPQLPPEAQKAHEQGAKDRFDKNASNPNK